MCHASQPSQITEEYVLIAETDHIFMTEPPNKATPTMPACFPFGYMNSKAPELRPIVARFVDDPDHVDPCGPSPVLIHVDLLRRLTPEQRAERWRRRTPLLDEDPDEASLPRRPPNEESGAPFAGLTELGRRLAGVEPWPHAGHTSAGTGVHAQVYTPILTHDEL